MYHFSSKTKKILMLLGFLCIMYVFAVYVTQPVYAETAEVKTAITQQQATIMKWGFLSAAICVGLGSLAAGIAVAYVGAAALGVIGERPELAPRALIFVGLAEGVAIYGLVLALMIIFKL